MVDLSALKSWRDSQLNLAHGRKEKIRETKNKNRVAQKKSLAIVHEGNPIRRSETTGVGFVKQVGFKPEVKEGVIDEQSGESEEEEVISEGLGESEIEELVLE